MIVQLTTKAIYLQRHRHYVESFPVLGHTCYKGCRDVIRDKHSERRACQTSFTSSMGRRVRCRVFFDRNLFSDYTYLLDERGQNGSLFTVTKTLMTLEETRRCKFISSWHRVLVDEKRSDWKDGARSKSTDISFQCVVCHAKILTSRNLEIIP